MHEIQAESFCWRFLQTLKFLLTLLFFYLRRIAGLDSTRTTACIKTQCILCVFVPPVCACSEGQIGQKELLLHKWQARCIISSVDHSLVGFVVPFRRLH